MPVVTAEIPRVEDCPVLTRTKAFVVRQGVVATLEHTLRNRNGTPLDLTQFEGFGSPGPDSVSDTLDDAGAVFLRTQELVAYDCAELRETTGEVISAEGGVVRADVPSQVSAVAGVYRLSWGVQDAAGDLVAESTALLSVERSLWGELTPPFSEGPPTIDEIRLATMDTIPDNLWFDNLEFRDDQILHAIIMPVRIYNELPPRLPRKDTRDFPWKGHWLRAVIGYLCHATAQNYRRTSLPYSAGGLTVDDRSKAAEYKAQGDELIAEWREFCLLKRTEISTRMASGSLCSTYY